MAPLVEFVWANGASASAAGNSAPVIFPQVLGQFGGDGQLVGRQSAVDDNAVAGAAVFRQNEVSPQERARGTQEQEQPEPFRHDNLAARCENSASYLLS